MIKSCATENNSKIGGDDLKELTSYTIDYQLNDNIM